jgi:hypothetical protein
MKIDITKKYRTKDAKLPVTIVSTDGPYPGFPVVGYIHPTGNPWLNHWSEAGGYPANTNMDLIEVREPREWTLSVKPGTLKVSEIYEDDGPLDLHGWERVRVREIID